MIKRDERYGHVKPLVAFGKIQLFTDIFKSVPKTIVANDLGKKVDRFNVLMAHPEEFTVRELFRIAAFCGLTEDEIFSLVKAEYLENKSKIKRTKKS